MSRAFQCSRVCVCLAVVVGVIGSGGWATADIVNGDFTTGTTGWTSTGGGANWLDSTSSISPDGPSVTITNLIWFYQPTLNTNPPLIEGTNYRASFKAALLAPGSDPDNAILFVDVTTGGSTQARLMTPLLDSTWRQYSLDFTATAADASGGYRVSFLSGYAAQNGLSTTADQVFGIDSVSLAPAPVPEPSTLVLLSAGLLGLLAYAWRKRK